MQDVYQGPSLGLTAMKGIGEGEVKAKMQAQ